MKHSERTKARRSDSEIAALSYIMTVHAVTVLLAAPIQNTLKATLMEQVRQVASEISNEIRQILLESGSEEVRKYQEKLNKVTSGING